MDCVNHKDTNATAYCQNCGKALCVNCVRNASGGQILCETCWTTWQNFQQPFAGVPMSGEPNPSAAAVLGLIPGVGAMYNGQFFKGFIHVVIFAILIGITENYPLCGLFIGFWVLYQSFEAFQTAKATRDGLPVPDPFGLNELGNWLNIGTRLRNQGQPGVGQAPPIAGVQPPAAGEPQPPYQAPYQDPYQAQYPPPPGGFVPPPGVPPPPISWQRKEPVAAIVLIALGLMFLIGEMKYAFPLLLIGLGVWLIVRRIGDSQGGSK
jgi:TM2 domain-containing membrane protein YozV